MYVYFPKSIEIVNQCSSTLARANWAFFANLHCSTSAPRGCMCTWFRHGETTISIISIISILLFSWQWFHIILKLRLVFVSLSWKCLDISHFSYFGIILGLPSLELNTQINALDCLTQVCTKGMVFSYHSCTQHLSF